MVKAEAGALVWAVEGGLVSCVGVIVRIVAVFVRRSAGGERRWWGWRAIGVAGDMRGLDLGLGIGLGGGLVVS